MTNFLNYRYVMLVEHRRAGVVFTGAEEYARPLDDLVTC